MAQASAGLRSSLEMLASESASNNQSGLENLKAWLDDSRNVARALSDNSDIFALVIAALLRFMEKQVEALQKAGGRRFTFRGEGAHLLERSVKLAAASQKRGKDPPLIRVRRILWKHLETVLDPAKCAALHMRQANYLPYYCRVVKELALGASLGFLTDLRQDNALRRNIIASLLKLTTPEGLSSGVDALTVLIKNADTDPTAEVADVASMLLSIASTQPKVSQHAAACLSALMMRCPYEVRDWMLADTIGEKLATTAEPSLSSRASESWDLVLRYALGVEAISSRSASMLLPRVAELLDTTVRAELTESSSASQGQGFWSARVVRLSDLLAAFAMRAEPTVDRVVQKLEDNLYSKPLLWGLAAARLCECFGQHLVEAGLVPRLLESFRKQLERVSRTSLPELRAMQGALTAALALLRLQIAASFSPSSCSSAAAAPVAATTTTATATATAAAQPQSKKTATARTTSLSSGRFPRTPVALSCLFGDGTGPLVRAPPIVAIPDSSEWEAISRCLTSLSEWCLVAFRTSPPTPSWHQLLSVLLPFLPDREAEPLVRQIVSQRLTSRPAQQQMDKVTSWCLATAVRRCRPDLSTQQELLSSLNATASASASSSASAQHQQQLALLRAFAAPSSFSSSSSSASSTAAAAATASSPGCSSSSTFSSSCLASRSGCGGEGVGAAFAGFEQTEDLDALACGWAPLSLLSAGQELSSLRDGSGSDEACDDDELGLGHFSPSISQKTCWLLNGWMQSNISRVYRRSLDQSLRSAFGETFASASTLLDEDLRIFFVLESLELRPVPDVSQMEWAGHHPSTSSSSPPNAQKHGKIHEKTPFSASNLSSSPLESAVLGHFLAQAEVFDKLSDGDSKVSSEAAQLLSRMQVLVVALPQQSKVWGDRFRACFLRILDLVRGSVQNLANVQQTSATEMAKAQVRQLTSLIDSLNRSGVLGGSYDADEGFCSWWRGSELWSKLVTLPDICTTSWTMASPSSSAADASLHRGPDLFGSRGTSALNARSSAGGGSRTAGMPAAVSLLCAIFRFGISLSGLSTGLSSGSAGIGFLEQFFDGLQAFLEAMWRSHPLLGLPLWRWTLKEVNRAKPSPFSSRLVQVLVDLWSNHWEPLCHQERADYLSFATNLLASAEVLGTSDLVASALQRFWGTVARGEPRLGLLVQENLGTFSVRVKVEVARILLHSLKRAKLLPALATISETVTDFVMEKVPGLILDDASCETRFSVNRTCTRLLFQLFESQQVLPEFAALLDRLDGLQGPQLSTSHVRASLQVVAEACKPDGCAGQLIPEICTRPPTLNPSMRLILDSLDLGRRIPLTLQFRTQIFMVHLSKGRPIEAFDFDAFGLGTSSQEGPFMYHLASLMAALVIEEQLVQLPALAEAMGLEAGQSEFESRIFVFLAGSVLPFQRTLAPLQGRYGKNVATNRCKAESARIFAFSLQLPFLTVGKTHALTGQDLGLVFPGIDKALPWTDLRKFVTTHFRYLLGQLDLYLQSWAQWYPGVAAELMRSFLTWVGPLDGSSLRLAISLLLRHGLSLSGEPRREVCTVISAKIAEAPLPSLVALVRHQDVSLRELFSFVEREWPLASSYSCNNTNSNNNNNNSNNNSNSKTNDASSASSALTPDPVARRNADSCPALQGLATLLRSISKRPSQQQQQQQQEGGEHEQALDWLRLQVTALLPRLHPLAREVLSQASPDNTEPPAKRMRRTVSKLGVGVVLKQIGSIPDSLAWGPAPALDLGVLARWLSEDGAASWQPTSKAPTDAQTQDEDEQAKKLEGTLKMLAQPEAIASLRSQTDLAKRIAVAFGSCTVGEAEGQTLDSDSGCLEAVFYKMIQNSAALPSCEDLIASSLLMSASVLQAFPSLEVRRGALRVLDSLVRQTSRFRCTVELLSAMLEPKHLCLEDLRHLHSAFSTTSPAFFSDLAGRRPPSSENLDGSKQASKRARSGEVDNFDDLGGWGFFLTVPVEDGFSNWIREVSTKAWETMGQTGDVEAREIRQSAGVLMRNIDWFAERMLSLALLRASQSPLHGAPLAKALSRWLRDASLGEASCIQSIIRAIHLVRIFQTGHKKRAVPHFPSDMKDPFWPHLDYSALAEGASKVGWGRDGLMFFEMHMSFQHPETPIDQTIISVTREPSVDELFAEPTREVQLLHALARQVPDDDMLYGVSEWCHLSSRLVRTELGRDHLTSLYLRSGMRESFFESGSQAPEEEESSRVGLEAALAKLGLHSVLASEDLPQTPSAAVLERRMEGLWRMRQWGALPAESTTAAAAASPPSATATATTATTAATTAAAATGAAKTLSDLGALSSGNGFHARIYGALAAIARGSRAGTLKPEIVEQPLVSFVPEVAQSLRNSSSESFSENVVRLQMLGSTLAVAEATAAASSVQAAGGPGSASQGSLMDRLAGSWCRALQDKDLSPQQFLLQEPLHSARSALLSLTASPEQQLRFSTSLAASARSSGQPHRALGWLDQAQRDLRKTESAVVQRGDVLRLYWERAQCLWEINEQREALAIAKAVTSEAVRQGRAPVRSNSGLLSAQGSSQKNWVGRALSLTGMWLAESRLEDTEVVRRSYFEPALNCDDTDPLPRRQFADFLDEQLAAEVVRQKSVEHSLARDLHDVTQADLKNVRSDLQQFEIQVRARQRDPKDPEFLALRDQERKLMKQCQEDKEKFEEEGKRIRDLAYSCIEQCGKCLQLSGGKGLTKVACRFLSLWFDYSGDCPEITEVVQKCIPTLAPFPMTPFIYQLASRLDTPDKASTGAWKFQQTLEALLVHVISRSAHGLWPLLQLRNGDQIPHGMRNASLHVADQGKIAASERVMTQLRSKQGMASILEAAEVLSKFYINLAFRPIDKKNREGNFDLRQIQGYENVKALLKTSSTVLLPTGPPQTEGNSRLVGIKHFQESFSVAAQGISAPKIITVQDVTGREHKQVVKGLDDLRQDAVIQQLFRLLNDVFADTAKSRQADLRIRPFQVVPLTPCAGIAEWVSGTVTLGQLLTGNTKPEEGAHWIYRRQDWSHGKCRNTMASAREMANQQAHGAEPLRKALEECYDNFKPVMHLVFLEKFASPERWHRARRDYARSIAVSSIVGYIVGIGDRHPNNVLFDQTTGELVHIDFGITFDQGKALRIPELVPFRLSRDIVDGLGCLGTCGQFRGLSETTMEVLRASSSLITAVVEVFVHDPVYFWSMSWSRKVRQDGGVAGEGPDQASGNTRSNRLGRSGSAAPVGQSAAAASPSAQSGGENANRGPRKADDGNEMAKRAVLAVKGKLCGAHGTATALNVSAHVGCIIHEAIDINNLSKMFYGWSPWL